LTQQNIDFGTGAENDGEFIATAFQKIQANFEDLYAGNGSFLQSGEGAVSRTAQGKMRDVVSVRDFGVTGSGNETGALQAAVDYAFANNKELTIDCPVYITKVIVPSGSGAVSCIGAGELRPHATADQSDIYDSDLIEFGENVAFSSFRMKFDMLSFSKSAMRVRGSDNIVEHFYCQNITGAAGRTHNLWGLAINGDNNVVKWARSVDCVNAPGGVGCATVAVDMYAEGNIIEVSSARGGASAYLGNGNKLKICMALCDGTEDNGLYIIEGSEDVQVGCVIGSNCTDELIAMHDATNVCIGQIIATNCSRGVAFDDVTAVRVGKIDWYVDDPAINSAAPLFARSGNVSSTSLEIGELSVRGIWRSGAPIWSIDNGELTSLAIARICGRLTYDDATGTATKTLAFSSATIRALSIGELDIAVEDGLGTLTSSDVFRFNLPTTLSRPSVINAVRLTALGGSHLVRVLNVAQDSLKIDGVPTVRGDLNPPTIGNTDGGQITRLFGSGAAPTQGTWKRGDVVFNQAPSATGFIGWVCTTAGTPGTWVPFGPALPSSSTDNAVSRFNGVTGALQNSGVTIDDSNNLSGVTSITVGNTGLVVGTSTPFSDAAGTLTLQNVDAIDATTEATIEAAIDTLPNLASIQGVPFTFGAYAAILLNNANEAAFKAAVNLEIGVDVQAYDADLASWSSVVRAAGFDTFVGTPSSANLRSLLTDKTGSGALVFGTGPSLTNAAVGTQSPRDNSTKAASTAYVDSATREKLSANRTYYVRTDGSDSNNGLSNASGGAFLTLQKAIDTVSTLDIAGFNVTVQVGDGTYSEVLTLKNVVGFAAPGNLVIQGNTGDDDAVIVTTAGSVFTATGLSVTWRLRYMKIVGTNTNSGAITATNGSTIEIDNLVFGFDTTGADAHLLASNGGCISAVGNYAIDGGADRHFNAVDGGLINTAFRTVTFRGDCTFASGFAESSAGGIARVRGMTFTLGGFTVTGVRYSASSNGVINTTGGGASYLPGNSAGSTATGGQYV
jgi:hypothetical protein